MSPYRLAAHLGSAFAIYGTLVWTVLSLSWPAAARTASAAELAGAGALCRHVLPLAGLLALTAMSGALAQSLACWCSLLQLCNHLKASIAGAFVAGNDAGHAYNTFPLMGGRLVPEEYLLMPGWRNAFESTAAVQFHHRLLAVSAMAAVGLVAVTHRSTRLPKASRLLLNSLPAVTALQVGGLLYSAHQSSCIA